MAIYVVRERASRELRGEGGREVVEREGLAGRRMDLDVEWKQGNSRSARQRQWYAGGTGGEQREMLERGQKRERG